MTVCPEEESILMTSFVDTLARLQGKEGTVLVVCSTRTVMCFVLLMYMYSIVHVLCSQLLRIRQNSVLVNKFLQITNCL